MRFTLRCLNTDLVPVSLKLKCPIKGYRAHGIVHKAQRALLNERVRQNNYTLKGLSDKQLDQQEQLFTKLSSKAYDLVTEFTTHTQLSHHIRGK